MFKHTVVNLKTFLKNFKSSLTGSEASNNLNEAVAKTEQVQEHLCAQMAVNNSCLQKLRSKIKESATKNSLATGKTIDFISLTKDLEETLVAKDLSWISHGGIYICT